MPTQTGWPVWRPIREAWARNAQVSSESSPGALYGTCGQPPSARLVLRSLTRRAAQSERTPPDAITSTDQYGRPRSGHHPLDRPGRCNFGVIGLGRAQTLLVAGEII